MPRSKPNILITGTPGVGKTTTAEQLVSLTASSTYSLKHVSINDIAKRSNHYTSYDTRLQTQVLDEDALLDELETLVADGNDDGGWVFDYHVPDIFPERWIDLVVVLRCTDTREFWLRMEKRGYVEDKCQENIDAEIFGVVAEEAREGYPGLSGDGLEGVGDGNGDVWELENVDADQVDANCEMIVEWVEKWVAKRREDKGKDGEDEG